MGRIKRRKESRRVFCRPHATVALTSADEIHISKLVAKLNSKGGGDV